MCMCTGRPFLWVGVHARTHALTVPSGYDLPHSGYTIPIDVADGGASFQSSTIQCIYTDIGEAFWIIF